MSSRTILKSNPSWRFKYFHGKSENLYSRSYSKDLFYLIIFIVTASGKDCTLCFIFQCPAPLAGDSWAPRSKQKFFQGELCLLFFFCLSHCPWAVFDTKTMKAAKFLCHKWGPLRLAYNLPWRMEMKMDVDSRPRNATEVSWLFQCTKV